MNTALSHAGGDIAEAAELARLFKTTKNSCAKEFLGVNYFCATATITFVQRLGEVGSPRGFKGGCNPSLLSGADGSTAGSMWTPGEAIAQQAPGFVRETHRRRVDRVLDQPVHADL